MARKRCTKKAYATLAEASAAIREMGKKWNLVYRKPYRCAMCKAWHTTGTPPRRGRRIQR